MFEKTEGIDVHPAAKVAVASLISAKENNRVEKDAVMMLNITGGGEERFKQDNQLFYLKPDLIFDIDPEFDEVKLRVERLFNAGK